MSDQPAGDARDRLAELERKLRELEDELRGAAAGAAPQPPRPGPPRPEPGPPRPEPVPPAPEPRSWGRPPGAEQPAWFTSPAEQAATAPAAADPAGAEPARAELPRGEPAPPEPEAEAAPEPGDLAARARDQLAALVETLESLADASERMRGVARTVVEDHGRVLVRLERAAAAAERAAQAQERVPARVAVDAGPFTSAEAFVAFRDALSAAPGVRDVYLRGYEGGRAVLEVTLAPTGGDPPGP